MLFQFLVTLILIFSCDLSQASSAFSSSLQKVVTLSGGPGWYQTQQNQSVYLQSDYLNTYISNHSVRTLANGELFLGLQTSLHQHIQTQLGIAGALFSQAQLSGQIWELGDPTFNNLTYQYRVNHAHVAFAGKILSDFVHPHYLLYCSGSAGIARNKAYGFSSTPIIFEVLSQPPFSPHSQTAFTYTVGAGFLRPLNQHWQVGLGYALTDEGKSTLGPSSVLTTTERLTLNHLYVNTLQFSLSYLS